MRRQRTEQQAALSAEEPIERRAIGRLEINSPDQSALEIERRGLDQDSGWVGGILSDQIARIPALEAEVDNVLSAEAVDGPIEVDPEIIHRCAEAGNEAG